MRRRRRRRVKLLNTYINLIEDSEGKANPKSVQLECRCKTDLCSKLREKRATRKCSQRDNINYYLHAKTSNNGSKYNFEPKLMES